MTFNRAVVLLPSCSCALTVIVQTYHTHTGGSFEVSVSCDHFNGNIIKYGMYYVSSSTLTDY